jgi:two-component sensor histidine kinase
MNQSVSRGRLSEQEQELLAAVEANLPMTADLSRADVLLYVRKGEHLVVAAQARPHSMTPIHAEDLVGSTVSGAEEARLRLAFGRGRPMRDEVQRGCSRAPCVRELFPIRTDGRILAVAAAETNLIEHERHRRRSAVFRRALRAWQLAAFSRPIPGIQGLRPFGEQDGILFVDAQQRIRYLSGLAANFYRRLGFLDPLVGQHVGYLETGDDELLQACIQEGRCLAEEARLKDREWIRQALPVFGRALHWPWQPHGHNAGSRLVGAFLLVHDETEARQRARELKVKAAIIQETHHRIKNNLQTIAALLRLEARRTSSAEAKRALEESINRILSISVVHEFMANQGDGLINLREVAQRLVAHMRQMLASPEGAVSLSVAGPDLYLPSQQATVCSLIMNELLQNAVEHGFPEGQAGRVSLRLSETADEITIEVSDNGSGLPVSFDVDRDGSIGLSIVRVLVREDLKGAISLKSNPGGGVTASVHFPRRWRTS